MSNLYPISNKVKPLRATLRVCGACEWVFKAVNNDLTCPLCQFGSYGAHYVYGDKAYRYSRTQRPWFEKRMAERAAQLYKIIKLHSS